MRQASARKRALVLVHEYTAVLLGIDHLLPTAQGKSHHMMQLVRYIGHQIGVMVGRFDKHGLAGGTQGLELILEPDAVTIALDDVGEPLRVAKGARGTGAAVVVGLAARLLDIEYKCHGLYLQRHDLGAMELGDAQCRRDRITVGRGNAAAGKDGQAIARILDEAGQVIEVILNRRAGRAAMRQDARNTAVGKRVDCIELSFGRELIKRHVEGDVYGLALALLGRAARSHDESAEGELVERPAAGTGLAASKDQAVNAGTHGKAQVHLHHAQLVLAVMKVAATWANHAHHSRVMLVSVADCSANNAGRRRGATDGEVVTQLNAPRTGLDGRRHSLKVLGTKLVQHR